MNESVRPNRHETRADPAKLFAAAAVLNNDQGLISEYLAYECYRTRLDERFDLHGDLNEKLKIIHWYLTTYSQHRKRKLPWSAAQLKYLNSVIPILGLAHPMSIIAFSFIRSELGQHWDLNQEKISREAIYWWSIERSPELNVEDTLVSSAFIDLLNEVNPEQRWLPYHTNYFMERYHQVHPDLHFLDLTLEADRAAYLTYLILLSAQYPHFVRYLPQESVGRLLKPLATQPEFTVWDSIVASTCHVANGLQANLGEGGGTELEASPMEWARHKRAAITAMIENNGYSVRRATLTIDSPSGNFAACYRKPASPIGSIAEGISLIGPLNATSGLGQATRLSAHILETSRRPLSIINFDMDNPAPTGFATNTRRVGETTKVRPINLIHLNAESIPLAFAYLSQDFYKNSYNIGYFFWELTALPKCHLLALNLLDEIWVSSGYNQKIYSQNCNIPVTNVGMAVEPLPNVTDGATREEFALPLDDFIFLTTFDSFSFVERKNPLAVVTSFQAAFPDKNTPVRLLVKTQNRFKVDDPYQRRVWDRISQLCANDPRVTVINETFSYQELLRLKSVCNCYVSLHRSEGWGFGMIEAMQLGLPVIATGYSGNMEFCTDENCLLVDYSLIEPRADEYIFVERGSQWAAPNLATATSHMRAVVSQPTRAQALACAAKRTVAENFNIKAIAVRYEERLRAIEQAIGTGSSATKKYSLRLSEDPDSSVIGGLSIGQAAGKLARRRVKA